MVCSSLCLVSRLRSFASHGSTYSDSAFPPTRWQATLTMCHPHTRMHVSRQHARSMLGVEHVHIALLFVNVFLLMPLNAFLPATVALESFYLSTPRAAIAWYSNVTLAAFVMWLHTVLASKSRSAAAASALHPQVVALLRRERSIVLGFAGWCLVCLVLAIADFASGFVLGLFIVGFLMLGPLLPAALYIRKKALRCAKVCCRKSRTPPPVRPSASASISFAPHVDSTPTRLRFREAAIDVSRLISFSVSNIASSPLA